MGQTGKFGLRIVFKNRKKDFQWYIEKSLRDSEFKRYKKSWSVDSVKKVSR